MRRSMSRLRSLLLGLAFVLLPAVARADGIIDYIEKWSGPKLVGFGFDLHLFCATKDGKALPLCERIVYLKETSANDIKHIIDFRAVWYKKRDDVSFENATINATRNVHAQRLQAFYHYRIIPVVDVGAGIGYFRVSSPDDEFEPFTKGIVTPLSVSAAPFAHVERAALKWLRVASFR